MAHRISLTGLLTIILGLIVAAFVLMPFFTEVALAAHALRLTVEILLVIAVWRMSGHRGLLVWVAGIVLVNEVTEWLVLLRPLPGIVVLSELCTLVFIVTTASFIAWTAWRQHDAGAESLIGAVAVYFLIGYFWAGVFSLIEFANPGSISGVCDPRVDESLDCQPELARYPGLIYFSFVTMTTLGYGDMTPLTRSAQGMATMAAVTGQLFIAMVIGRLVSLYMVKRRDD
jgi:hypothetical protein